MNWHISISDIILVITVLVLAWQTYELRRSFQRSVWQNAIAEILSLEKLIIGSDELKGIFKDTYLRHPKIAPSSALFVELYLMVFEMIYTQRHYIEKVRWNAWAHFINNMLKVEAFKVAWKELVDQKEFTPDFRAFVDQVIGNKTT